MHIGRETKRIDCVCLGLVFLACGLHIIEYALRLSALENVILAIDAAAVLLWAANIRRRIVYWKARQYLGWAAVLMVVLMTNQTLRHLYFAELFYLKRHLWYISWFLLGMVALFQFFSILCIGKLDKNEIGIGWKLLYIPSAFFFALIMTNDLHQKVFIFPADLTVWSDSSYRPGAGYVFYIGWITALTVATLLTTFIKYAVTKKRNRLWIPLLPILLGVFCATVYFVPENTRVLGFFRHVFTIPEMACFSFAAEIELLILTGVFPSNDRYAELCNLASVGIGIMDHSGTIRYRSEKSPPVHPEQVRSAEHEPVMLDEQTALRSHSVSGGVSYWIKDVSEINRLTDEIAEHVDLLKRENSILDAENRLAENRARILEQTRLYDAITTDIHKQAQRLSLLLNEFSAGGEYRRVMVHASVLAAYIKRRANLMLLSNQNDLIRTEELALAISESLEAVRLSGMVCGLDIRKAEYIPSEIALLIYAAIEEVIEAVYADSNAIMIYVLMRDGTISLRIETDTERELALDEGLLDQVLVLNGTCGIKYENGTAYVTLFFSPGGEAQ